jgi:hypothetical protein
MDSEYKAPIFRNEGGSASCPVGKIRRVGYTTRRGVRVKSACIKDRGAPGRWRTVKAMLGIGPLRKGELRALGYDHMTSANTRHAALDRAVRRFGRNKTIRKLNAIATYTKRTAPSRSRLYKTDMRYVQKKF